MARTMLEYTKVVLNKVSFDTTLFCKELSKAIKRLLPHEIDELRTFVYDLMQSKPELSVCAAYLTP